MKVEYGTTEDIDSWMSLIDEVKWNFPGLETPEAVEGHRDTVLRLMKERRALCVKDAGRVIGVLLFSKRRNTVNFLAVAPDCRRQGIASALMKKALTELNTQRDITLTTFREEDPKSVAPRTFYKKFGFIPGELCIQFDYPLQQFVRKGRNGS